MTRERRRWRRLRTGKIGARSSVVCWQPKEEKEEIEKNQDQDGHLSSERRKKERDQAELA